MSSADNDDNRFMELICQTFKEQLIDRNGAYKRWPQWNETIEAYVEQKTVSSNSRKESVVDQALHNLGSESDLSFLNHHMCHCNKQS